jgi:predicted GNAT family acetyltransferase
MWVSKIRGGRDGMLGMALVENGRRMSHDSATTRAGAEEVTVRDNPDRGRYEVYVGSMLAGFADYHSQPGLVTVLHTEVDTRFEGRGLGSELVRRVLDDVRRRNAKVLAVCPFVRSFLQRHPEYADIVWKA